MSASSFDLLLPSGFEYYPLTERFLRRALDTLLETPSMELEDKSHGIQTEKQQKERKGSERRRPCH